MRITFIHSKLKTAGAFLFLYCIFIVFLSGCGSGNGNNAGSNANQILAVSSNGSSARINTGRAQLTIHWPERDLGKGRLIPVAANSIIVTGRQQNGAQVVQQTLTRPVSGDTTVLDLTGLPLGPLEVSAVAYPYTDGTGAAQAQGTNHVTIVADAIVPMTVVMNTTIDHIEAMPLEPLALKPGVSATITATALDSEGYMVLLSSTKTAWASSNPAVATVDGTGVVTAVGVGTAQITFSDAESEKSVNVAVTVAVPSPTEFYATSDHSPEIARYDVNGKRLDSLRIPSELTTDLRGMAFGPDGLLYVVGAQPDFRVGGFVVLTVDVKNTIRVAFTYSGVGSFIAGNAAHGKIAFDKNNHLLVGTLGGIVQFSLGGSRDSGTLLWSGDSACDIAVLPSGELLVIANEKIWRMAADGSNAQKVFSLYNGEGIVYDPETNTIFATALGASNDSFPLMAIDGTSYVLKNKKQFIYGSDLYLDRSGRLIVGASYMSPGIFDKDLNQLGSFEGDSRAFVTQGATTGITP